MERAGHSLRRPADMRYAPLPAVRHIDLADLGDVLASGVRDSRDLPDGRHFPLHHLSRGWSGPGVPGIRLWHGAARFPARLRLRADRSDRRGRSLRDEPPARAGPPHHVGGRSGSCARPRSARSWCWAGAAGDLPALAGRRLSDLPGNARPQPPVSVAAFVRDVFTTGPGWTSSSWGWASVCFSLSWS